jgi:8-oxo-dGTP pyrophosphatase MutT (NUDIX family)
MIDVADVTRMVSAFDAPADGSALKSCELVRMLLSAADDPFARTNFSPGHITCTGLVLAPDGIHVLAVHHRRLERWLLPGGHVEAADAAIASAARREVQEETDVELLDDRRSELVGVDVHGIPSNGREPYHLHHDLLFLLRARSNSIRVSEESNHVMWIHPKEFEAYCIPENIQRAYFRIKAGG